MMSTPLPVRPLLRTFLACEPGPPTVRATAIETARLEWFNTEFLLEASEGALLDRLHAFYRAVVDVPFHPEALSRRSGLVRHALNHLLHGQDPLPAKLDRCVPANGTYSIPGLGLRFWSAMVQATDPDRVPGWTPATELGLIRLGLLKRPDHRHPGALLRQMIVAYGEISCIDPTLTAGIIDRFLTQVAAMRGRELSPCPTRMSERMEDLVRQVRSKQPLRQRLKLGLPVRQTARGQLATALANHDAAGVRQSMDALGPGADGIHDDVLLEWSGRFWNTDDPYAAFTDFAQAATLLGAGSWLPATILHLRDPRMFPLWGDETRRGLAVLDDGFDPSGPMAVNYRLYAEACHELRRRFRLHPLEVGDVLAFAARESEDAPAADRFDGFCSDTFRFLSDLETHNDRQWMEEHRERYKFVIREPLVELCRALAARYVEPVLNRQFGWDLETTARTGQALSSVVRNDHGQTVPYESALWITYYRRAWGGKRDDVQLFVRLDPRGVSAGLKLGRTARDAGRMFRRNVQQHAESLYQALAATDALTRCRFVADNGVPLTIDGPADLRKWAAGKFLIAERTIPHDDPIVRGDELVGEVLLTFDRLLPAYRCAVEGVPQFTSNAVAVEPAEDADRFCEATSLSRSWLQTAMSLLTLKRQLILQGVPGTGKTHVARSLARLLTGGVEERVRLVQFHPGFSYEEFVEGIKARTIEVDGRHEVTYPVEDGVLCEFAARAAARPTESFVLLIDEINRGNLPRVFGELLYLLEYRGEEVVLPYSRRAFRLPPNLYLIGTMNAADRSVTLVDQALRRRFSFLEMPPDGRVLASWLTSHPPTDEALAARVVELFENLNRKLANDLGPDFQVGHSYFMAPDLTEARLRVIWEHHVRPVLQEYFSAHPQRLADYELDAMYGNRRLARTRGTATANR